MNWVMIWGFLIFMILMEALRELELLQQMEPSQHFSYLLVSLAQGTQGLKQAVEELAVLEYLFFHPFKLGFKGADHGSSVPQSKAYGGSY